MSAELAVFRCVGDVAAVLWVTKESDDVLYVTDNEGLAQLKANGTTRRILGMSRRVAYRYDDTVKPGEVPEWPKLRHF
jgi:hypothetical protein